MNSAYLFFLVILTFSINACSNRSTEKNSTSSKQELNSDLIVDNYSKLQGFSSGSGMAYHKGCFYAVGDDDPYLVKINSSGEITEKWQIWDTSQVKNGRINKPTKPDFEAIANLPYNNDTLLIIFGSGSNSPTRDIIILFNPKTEKLISLEGKRFFDWLKAKANLGNEEINLEGAAYHNDYIYLLNRHNNQMYTLPLYEFQHFITTGEIQQLSLTIQRFDLPIYKGDTARFSGASMLEGQNKLLFSATIETTNNWKEDGSILGSYMGIIDLNKPSNKTLTCFPVLSDTNQRFAGKIESLQGFPKKDKEVAIYFITDDDDGSTGWGVLTFHEE